MFVSKSSKDFQNVNHFEKQLRHQIKKNTGDGNLNYGNLNYGNLNYGKPQLWEPQLWEPQLWEPQLWDEHVSNATNRVQIPVIVRYI